jgi:AraC-like DNA-binding protein
MQASIDFLLCGQPERPPRKARLRRGDVAQHSDHAALFVRNLRFPFALQLRALRGNHRVQSGSRRSTLHEGSVLWIGPWSRFHYEGPCPGSAPPGFGVGLELDADFAPLQEATISSFRATLTLQVAHAVFAQPWVNWSVGSAAQRLHLPAARLCAGLFREGSALTEIVREQRLMHALVSLSASNGCHIDFSQSASWTGFESQLRFEAAFFRHFGCRACAANSLSMGTALVWAASRSTA